MSALEPVLGGPAIEVVAKVTRRRLTVGYKQKIVREAEGKALLSLPRAPAPTGRPSA